MNLPEYLFQLVQGADVPVPHVLHNAVNLAFGCQHAHHVYPAASVGIVCHSRVGLKAMVQEELQRELVVLHAFEQRRALDFAALVFVDVCVGRVAFLQVVQDVFPFYD